MPYDKNDPRRIIELELTEVMQQGQIEYLMDYAINSDADHIGEIAYLKQQVIKLANALEPLAKMVSPAKARDDLAALIAGVRLLVNEEDSDD